MAISPDESSPRSISTDDLRVVFQPIVALDAGALFASEALVRCRLPAFDRPERLFEAAEVEHSCGRLGRVIRELAFAQAPDVPLFVNLHPQELSSRWLVRPDDPMNFHPHPVYLEITESAAFDHFDLVMSTLKEVCSRNDARLVVDDFGAGYSNLKRVAELEPAVVKLDRELVRGLHQSQRQQALVAYVVRLCNALGARVVAEGIETPGELRAARDCGVDYGQGYLLARPGNPMPVPSFPLEPSARYSRRPCIESRMSAPPRSRRSSRPRRFPIKR
jgi:EAL domain-containing protein (putative c-di-GMP-specific phosphodiesterase class I)